MLTHTKSGLANEHLLYKSDFVVYLEGGKSYTKEEAFKGDSSNGTLDILFWERLFMHFAPNKRFKLKSVGSKTVVLEIAKEIVKNDIDNCLAGMDNEFDEILNKRIIHKNIFYTHGYSWENDVWSNSVVRDVIEHSSATRIPIEDIEKNLDDFERKIRIGVLADGMLFESGGDSFFNRDKGLLFCVDCKPRDLPCIKEDALLNRLAMKTIECRHIKQFEKKHHVDTLKLCYGHLLADYCCQVILHYLKNRLSISSPSNEILYRMGIVQYFDHHFQDSIQYAHYKSQFERLVS